LDKPDRRVEWRSILDFPTEAVAREARSADLVIIPAIARSRDPFRALDPGSAILKAGRPVLVVPTDLASLSPRRIAIAWKDTREARRAVLDALPFLQKSDSVVIVEMLEEGRSNGASDRLRDVARYLARHRVEIITEQVSICWWPAPTATRGWANGHSAELLATCLPKVRFVLSVFALKGLRSCRLPRSWSTSMQARARISGYGLPSI
jgi:hypothetical protein